jgi:hypothetical protein
MTKKKKKEGAVKLSLVEHLSPVLVIAEDSQYNEGSYIMQDT